MHDGYLFTLGVCGSASADNPALTVLDTLLGSLPPVKRAAFLGDRGALEKNGCCDDEFLQAVVADLCDAELLILVTPVGPVSLPDRLACLLDHALPLADAGVLREKVVLLVGIAQSTEQTLPFDHLQRFCIAAGMTLAAAVVVHADTALEYGTLDLLKQAAQHAYTQSRRGVAGVLP